MSSEIALLVSTYQRPRHLRLALDSIARQEGVDGRFEVVVTDDGSTDETEQVVREFDRRTPFRVGFTTHPHTTFRLASCRNEGVRASSAPYLLFLDGDCVLPPDHVRVHLERRRIGVVQAGDCCRLEQAPSEKIMSEMAPPADLERLAPQSEHRRLKKLDRSSRFYRLIRHPTKPKLIGNNVGIWRNDYERINGYDENFEGWGCEDDDLRYRLRKCGVCIESILRWTKTYHLWHPTDVTAPDSWRQGANVAYLRRRGRLTRCRNGLFKRDLQDLSVRIVGEAEHPQVAQLADGRFGASQTTKPEVEILILPGKGRFSGRADCNVLVALAPEAAKTRAARQADLTVTPNAAGQQARFDWGEVEQALRAVA